MKTNETTANEVSTSSPGGGLLNDLRDGQGKANAKVDDGALVPDKHPTSRKVRATRPDTRPISSR